MRTRSIIAIFTALALLIFAFLWGSAVRPIARPSIAIGVLNYGRESRGFVHVGITNLGYAALKYKDYTFDPNAWVLTVSRTGIATRGIGVADGGMRRLLWPGSNTVASIRLPPDTLTWRVAYKVRNASLRQRVESAVPNKWRSLLYPLCRLLSDREGPEQEIQSGRFERPHSEPPTVDGGMGLLFGSDTFWPAATEAGR
jgi:hypothetical protein